jgi:hypothetical protein
MHPNFEELLSLRDGGLTDAATLQHVASCTQCKLELVRLKQLQSRLHQLPQFSPPPLVWTVIREELGRLPAGRLNLSWLTVYAASVVGAVVALALLWSIHPGSAHLKIDSIVASSVEDRKDALGSLVTRSQQLEGILQGLPQRPTVQRAATSVAIDELQTRIQVVDLQLAAIVKDEPDRAQIKRLWNARVQLLNSLVYMRYAEAARDGNTAANLPLSGVI